MSEKIKEVGSGISGPVEADFEAAFELGAASKMRALKPCGG